jgi:imidazolonepropionase-like amidohydrolase
VGSIAPGKYADITAVEGDGLADLKRSMKVGFVMKGDTVYLPENSSSRRQ